MNPCCSDCVFLKWKEEDSPARTPYDYKCRHHNIKLEWWEIVKHVCDDYREVEVKLEWKNAEGGDANGTDN